MKDWPWYSFLVLAVVLFAAIYLFFFKPREATIANTREERIRVENEVTKLKAQQRQLDQIKN
ncbi:MAG: hypothetical protein PVI11_06920, partial [Candidatus Aminicenantes bacterium]